jgi:hypothetical protein
MADDRPPPPGSPGASGPDSTALWSISEFERRRSAGQLNLGHTTLLPTTLLADLQRLRGQLSEGGDVVEVAAACLHHREPALLYLGCGSYVWPVTLFPAQGLYHSPRAVEDLSPASAIGHLRVLSTERPNLRPPGTYLAERVGHPADYRSLAPLLWILALDGPRHTLLGDIPVQANFRLASGASLREAPLAGALGPAVERLRRRNASLRDIAGWPGMSVERASRLLNGLYLTGGLMVLRSGGSRRPEASSMWWQWLTRRR